MTNFNFGFISVYYINNSDVSVANKCIR